MVVAAIAAFTGAALQSAVGFGFALVAGPALFGFLEPNEALTTLIILGTAVNLLVLYGERRPRRVSTERVVPALAWSVPGLIAGALILAALSKPALQIAVGVAVLIAVVVQVRVRSRPVGDGHVSPKDPAWVPPAVGLTTGVLGTTTGTSGPPLVLWFQRLELSPAEFRDSLAVAFLALNVLAIAALLAFGGGVATPGAGELAVLMAVAFAGEYAGRHVFSRLDPRWFRVAGLVVVVGAGVASAVAGLAAL